MPAAGIRAAGTTCRRHLRSGPRWQPPAACEAVNGTSCECLTLAPMTYEQAHCTMSTHYFRRVAAQTTELCTAVANKAPSYSGVPHGWLMHVAACWREAWAPSAWRP